MTQILRVQAVILVKKKSKVKGKMFKMSRKSLRNGKNGRFKQVMEFARIEIL